MRRLLSGGAAIAIAALLLLPTTPASAIVGGAPDDGEHPYVGQLLVYVPNAVDPRFDDPACWFNCTGILIDADTGGLHKSAPPVQSRLTARCQRDR